VGDAQTGLGAVTRPFRDRWVQYLLEHIDWSTPYDAQGLGATIEATIDLVYDDLTSETLGVTLDAHAVELVRHGAHYLYLVHPHADLGAFVEDLRRAQQALDDITTKYLGESPAAPGRAPSKLLREALALELGEDLAGLAAAELLARPVLILPGIDQAMADVLRETVGVVTVGDLAATGAKTTAAALARMIRDLDRG
jgi:hypothetical protein